MYEIVLKYLIEDGLIGQCRLKREGTAQQQPDGDTVRLLIYLVHKIINRWRP